MDTKDWYYVLCIRRRQGKIIDKYYRRTKEEIIALENLILSGSKTGSIHVSKYRTHKYCDISDIYPFD